MAQKNGEEMDEVSLKNEKIFTKMGSDLCQQKTEGHCDGKASSSPQLLGEKKEEKLDCEAGSILPKLEVECEVGDDCPNVKAPNPVQSVELLQEVKEEAEEMGLFIPFEEREEGGKKKKRKATKRKREGKSQEEEEGGPLDCNLKLDDTLDRTLEDGAKQHNLTAVNVRNILHEVITNEHVVAMMKAAISETEDIPMFEPKMTRSKLKEVVEKGVVIPTWNISPIKKANEIKQPPQFVDIPLEEDDSSDEEYQPEEEEEDETAEESLLESDVESTASSPRGAKRSRTRQSADVIETDEEGTTPLEAEKDTTLPFQRHISAEVMPMGPPPPPKPKQSKDSTFMEKLHAVDEELASSPVCMDSYQPLEDSLIAFRTRSKRPLKDVPLGQLEAELRAPDITPDMYDPNTADDEDWKRWLSGLMNDDVENEDEADDDDDPEYNFLEDLDEPDTEDFRNDRAVRITKKEVNELMEELFETFQDEMGFSNVEDEGPEDEDSAAEARPNFNTPQVLRFEEPLANLLNEQHRTVKEQLEQLRMKKSAAKVPQELERSKLRNEKPVQALTLDAGQRKRLQQQMQQHVQLLMQIHLLSSANPSLHSEANTTRLFLTELDTFAQSSILLSQPLGHKFHTAFQPCNLKEALQLVADFHSDIKIEWSPRKAIKKNDQPSSTHLSSEVVNCKSHHPQCMVSGCGQGIIGAVTSGGLWAVEYYIVSFWCLILLCQYFFSNCLCCILLISTSCIQAEDSHEIPYYKTTKQLPVFSRLCEEVQPSDWKPPIEYEEHRLPFWLKASLPSIQEELEKIAGKVSRCATPECEPVKAGREPAEPGHGDKYPLSMPEGLQLILRPLNSRFCRKAWRRQRPSTAKPLPVRPGLCFPPTSTNSFFKMAAKHPQPQTSPSKGASRVPRLIQPAPVMQPLPGVQHINLQPAIGNSASFELRGMFSAQHPDPRACLAPTVPQNLISTLPIAFQPKMILPTLPASRIRKPGTPRGCQKKKLPRATPLLKAAPLLQSTPVIFTVPTGAVKVVGIANSCNMLQPLTATPTGRPPQPIPITTLLVNPAPFPCPLSQPLAAPPAPSLVVSSSSSAPPASMVVRAARSPPAGPILAEAKTELQELSSCTAVSAEKDSGLWSSDPNSSVQLEVSIRACAERTEESPSELPATPFSPLANAAENEKAEFEEESSDAPQEATPIPEMPSSLGLPPKEELVLDLGQELDIEPPLECANEPKKNPSKQSSCENGKGGLGAHEPHLQGTGTASKQNMVSPKVTCNSTASESDFRGSQTKPEDESSAEACAMGLPVSQETAAEKDGPEEEEEEDFDDYIQDEEDEEMSSASEESVLSVPELQETMEKLTWLASERRLSQEGDSEEENSQEENSEPEEEEEEEEEGEGENLENLQKEDEITDEVTDPGDSPALSLTLTCSAPEVEPSSTPSGENAKAPGKSRNSYRARAKRGRTRASKDTSKLLLLYDEDILERDPLREQKDLAFAQAYLSRVREALRNVPEKYEEFLRIIYEFESNVQKQTAVDLYAELRNVLQEWPQLLTDFAAFLLPDQALECGLFEEQQAFEKSRKFLRQLEICFAENPSHHQKIIKVLQSCAECLPQEIMELKTQMWQLLKGHDHLQDEFSVFFDHLRPSSSRLGDFEEIHWMEEKDYEFDGFEEVSLPEVEEEEEPPKIHTASKNKRRKELGIQNTDKESEWPDGIKECFCSCHEGSSDLRMKRSKRRTCSHCISKAADGKFFRNKDHQELAESVAQQDASPCHEGKDPAEEGPEQREEGDLPQNRMRSTVRKADFSGAGSRVEGKPPSCKEISSGGTLSCSRTAEPCSLPGSPNTKKAGDVGKQYPPNVAMSPIPQTQRGLLLKPPRPKNGSSSTGGGNEIAVGLSSEELSSGLCKEMLEPVPLDKKWTESLASESSIPEEPIIPTQSQLQNTEADRWPASVELRSSGKEIRGSYSKDSGLKAMGTIEGLQTEAEVSTGCSSCVLAAGKKGKTTQGCLQELLPAAGGRECSILLRGDDLQQRAVEATVCAKNIKVSSTGEKVVLWTREADRVILTTCQEQGATPDTFNAISQQLHNKTAEEVAHRFRELMTLFHTACDISSEDEEDGMSTSNTDHLSDKEPVLSEEEQEEPCF
ncbi:GON-4-like protein [Sceloporus undulatus]|uniref:GON-4-like protein n=1 Tax=Sceloporus undulatus TaxID=8520 RepID=UPI001C4A89B3|nr:GON-4-like protein [Sceloporus undulatus]